MDSQREFNTGDSPENPAGPTLQLNTRSSLIIYFNGKQENITN